MCLPERSTRRHPPPISFEGGDGDSIDHAVIIRGRRFLSLLFLLLPLLAAYKTQGELAPEFQGGILSHKLLFVAPLILIELGASTMIADARAPRRVRGPAPGFC